ncbi:hypothetical protein DUI87_34724 [Hirundo rustica rustica]|uniref:Uncharacterized protein n=1 Tax=Hirundo rustica rustica TaxID=333673 RepID=A0A3M0IHA6_HIRRU|nr:hypothetical protein DUI87_34724 [Hirundo rustica rustica]
MVTVLRLPQLQDRALDTAPRDALAATLGLSVQGRGLHSMILLPPSQLRLCVCSRREEREREKREREEKRREEKRERREEKRREREEKRREEKRREEKREKIKFQLVISDPRKLVSLIDPHQVLVEEKILAV